MPSYGTDVYRPVRPKVAGQRGPGSTPVRKLVADQDAIDPCVVPNILRVWASVRIAVMGVLLLPLAIVVPVVDVVSVRLLPAATQVRSFPSVLRARPVFLECHDVRYPHYVHDTAHRAILPAPGADDPIPDVGAAADFRLARRKCTYSKKWIRREPVVSRDDIGIQSHPFNVPATDIYTERCCVPPPGPRPASATLRSCLRLRQ